MIVMHGEIARQLVEISLGNRPCDPQELFPDGHAPPLGSTGRAPNPSGIGTAPISFSGCCHVAIIAKSNRANKEARGISR
jgi:hypothetical protein